MRCLPAEHRELALRWLREDLELWRKRAKGAPKDRSAVSNKLRHWKADRELAGVRDKLDALPAAERDSWRAFWSEVDQLLETVSR